MSSDQKETHDELISNLSDLDSPGASSEPVTMVLQPGQLDERIDEIEPEVDSVVSGATDTNQAEQENAAPKRLWRNKKQDQQTDFHSERSVWGRLSDTGGVISAIGVLIAWGLSAWGPLSCYRTVMYWLIVFACVLVFGATISWCRHAYQSGRLGKYHVLTLAISLVALLYATGLAMATFLPPKEMDGQFNVAVAEFKSGIGRSQVCNSIEGDELTTLIVDSLNEEFNTLGQGTEQVEIVRIASINSPEQAAQLADQLNANVVIWGSVLKSDTRGFIPEFIVNETDEAFEVASRLSQGQKATDPFDQSDIVTARTRILSEFVLGLYSLFGDNPDQAMLRFKRALDIVEQSGQGTEAKPIFYYYAGRTANHLGESDVAKDYLEAGLGLDPEYAVLYLSLGNIHLMRGYHPYDSKEMDEAEIYYLRALNSERKFNTDYVDGKAHYSLGNVALYRALGGESDEYFEHALAEFELARESYQNANADSRYLSVVSFEEAYLYEKLGQDDEAANRYREAIRTAGARVDIAKWAEEGLARVESSP